MRFQLVSRRKHRFPLPWRLMIPLLAGTIALAACGTEESSESQPSSDASLGSAPETTSPEETAFPVTIDHKYGSTEIVAEPERVVTVGFTDQDPVLALGVKPVGVFDWYGDYPFGTWPWAQDELGNSEPDIISTADGDYNFEQIAALQPDLIIGQYTAMTDQQYATLAQIAPTVAQSGDYEDFTQPWQEQTRVIGRAVGREDRANEMIAEVEKRFAQERESQPEFEGKTVVYSDWDPGIYYPIGSEEPKYQWLLDLGFEPSEAVDTLVSDPAYAGNISGEQLELYDSDVLVWNAASVEDLGLRDQLGAHPFYATLDVVREGRVIFLDKDVLRGAVNWSTVLSLPFLLDDLVPRLAAAADGDPATDPNL